jgi:hypothetical protein
MGARATGLSRDARLRRVEVAVGVGHCWRLGDRSPSGTLSP